MRNADQRQVFVQNLKNFMKNRGVEQADIVAELGITASTVSDWVKGKSYPRVDAMQKIAEFLGVKISDLTSEENNNNQAVLTDEDERELIAIFRRLGRRAKHEMMVKAYELEKEANNSQWQ